MELAGTAVGPLRPGPPARPELRVAGHLAGSVLGAGMLVVPPVVAALAGGRALAVWSVHLLLGGAVSLMLAMTVRARPTTLAGAVGDRLGPWAERVVDGTFAVAFTAGQAAIAWFVAACLLAAADGALPAPTTAGLLLAFGVLLVAVLAALVPWTPPAALLRLRPWVAGGLALASGAVAWPAAGPAFAPVDLSPAAGLWLALAVLFFAGVGWESVTAVVPATAAGPRRAAAGVALGTAAVAVVYLGLAGVRQLAAGPPPAAPLRWVLAGATAVVLTSYCFTNVRAAARITARLRPGLTGRDPALVAAVGAGCFASAWAGARDGAVPLLLLGPAAAALVGYGLAAVAAVRRG